MIADFNSRKVNMNIVFNEHPKLYRGINESIESFLFRIYNKFGYRDLCLAYSHGDQFSKWIKYENLMHLEDWQYVKGTTDKKREFINKVTHRSILDIELLFDIDDLNVLGIKVYDTIKEKAMYIYFYLKKKGLNPVMYFTGSKSYHISVIIPKLRQWSKYRRTKYKEEKLIMLGGDTMKKSDRCLISLENCIHYKSGVIKELVLK